MKRITGPIIFTKNYRKMTMKWSFSYNSFEKTIKLVKVRDSREEKMMFSMTRAGSKYSAVPL